MSQAIVPLPYDTYPSIVLSTGANTKFRRTDELFHSETELQSIWNIPVTLGEVDPVASAGGVKFCTVNPPDLRAMAKKCRDAGSLNCNGFGVTVNPNKVARCTSAGVPDPSVTALNHKYHRLQHQNFNRTPALRSNQTTYFRDSVFYSDYNETMNGVNDDKQLFVGTYINDYTPNADEIARGTRLNEKSQYFLGKPMVDMVDDASPNFSFLNPNFHARTDNALIGLRRGLGYSKTMSDIDMLNVLDVYAPVHAESRMGPMCSGNITITDANKYVVRSTDTPYNTDPAEPDKFCYEGAVVALCSNQSYFNANPHVCRLMIDRAKSHLDYIRDRPRQMLRNLEIGDNFKSYAAEVFGTMLDSAGGYANTELFDPSIPCRTKANYDASPYLCPSYCLMSQANAVTCGLGTQCLTEKQSTPQCVTYCNSPDIAKSNGGVHPCDAGRLQTECRFASNFDTPLCKGYFDRNPTQAYNAKLAHCTGDITDPVCKDYAAAIYTNQSETDGNTVTFSMQEQLDDAAKTFCDKLKADLKAANLAFPIDYDRMTPEMKARCDFCACLISPIGDFGQPTCADTRCQATGWRTAGMKDVTKSCASCMQIISAAGNFINLAGNTQTMTCGGDGGNVVQYSAIPEEQKMAAKYSQMWRETRTTADGKIYYVSSAKDVAQMLDIFLGDVSMLASASAATPGNLTQQQMISFMNAFGENHVDSMWTWVPLNSATEVPGLISSMVSTSRNRAFVNRLLTHRATPMGGDVLTPNGRGARDSFRLIVLRDDYYDRLNTWANPPPDYDALTTEYTSLWRTYNETTNKFVYTIPALGPRLEGFITHPSIRMAPGATNEATVEPYVSANIQRLRLFLFALVKTNVTASGTPIVMTDTETLINLLITNATIATYAGFAWSLINMKATSTREAVFRAQLAANDTAVAAYYDLLSTAMRPSRRGYQVYKAIYTPPDSMLLVTKYRYVWAVVDTITDAVTYNIGLTALQVFDKIAADGSINTVGRSTYINVVNLLNFVYKTLGVSFSAANFYTHLTTNITVAKTNMLVMWLTNTGAPIESAFIDTSGAIATAEVHNRLYAHMINPINRDDATALLTPPSPVEQLSFSIYKQYRRVNTDTNVMFYDAPATLVLVIARLLGDEVMRPTTPLVSDVQFEAFMIAYSKVFSWRNASGALIYPATGAGNLLIAAITDRTDANKAFYRKLLAVFIARSFVSSNATAAALAINMASLFDAKIATQIGCNVNANRSSWQAVTTLQDLYSVVADVSKADVRYSAMPVSVLDNLVYIFRTNTTWLNMADSRLLLINMLNALVMIYENTGTAFAGIEFTTFVGGLPLDSARKIIQTLLQIRNMADVSTADITPIYTASTKYGDIVNYITDPLVIDSLQSVIRATYSYDAFSTVFQNRYRMSNNNAFYYNTASKTPIQLFDEMLAMAEMNVATGETLGTDQYYSMLIAFYDLFTWRNQSGGMCFTPTNGDIARDILIPAFTGQVSGVRGKFYGKLVGTFNDDGGIFKDTRIAIMITNIKTYMLRDINLIMVRGYLMTTPSMEYNNTLCRTSMILDRSNMTIVLGSIQESDVFTLSKTIGDRFDASGDFQTAYLSVINLFELIYAISGRQVSLGTMISSASMRSAWAVKLPEYEYETIKTAMDPRIRSSRVVFDALRATWRDLSITAYSNSVIQRYAGMSPLIIDLINSNLYTAMQPGNYAVRMNYDAMPSARDIIDSLLPINSVPDDRCGYKLTLAMASFYMLAIDVERDGGTSSRKFSDANDEAVYLLFDSRRAGFANCILGAGMENINEFPDAVRARLYTLNTMVQAKITQLLPPSPGSPPTTSTPTPTPNTTTTPLPPPITQVPEIMTTTTTALLESVAAQDQANDSLFDTNTSSPNTGSIFDTTPRQPPNTPQGQTPTSTPNSTPNSNTPSTSTSTAAANQSSTSSGDSTQSSSGSSSSAMIYIIIALIVVIIVVVASGGKKSKAVVGGEAVSSILLSI